MKRVTYSTVDFTDFCNHQTQQQWSLENCQSLKSHLLFYTAESW